MRVAGSLATGSSERPGPSHAALCVVLLAGHMRRKARSGAAWSLTKLMATAPQTPTVRLCSHFRHCPVRDQVSLEYLCARAIDFRVRSKGRCHRPGMGVREKKYSLKSFAFSTSIIPDPSEQAARLVPLPCGRRKLQVNLRLLAKQLGTTHTKLPPFSAPSLAINDPEGAPRGCKFSPGTSSNL